MYIPVKWEVIRKLINRIQIIVDRYDGGDGVIYEKYYDSNDNEIIQMIIIDELPLW